MSILLLESLIAPLPPPPWEPIYVLPGGDMPDGTDTPASYPGTGFTPTRARAVVHSTRSGTKGSPTECIGTLRYCSKPASKASYNWLIDRDGTIYEMTGWNKGSWHADYLNSTHYGIALVQGTIDDPITLAQHRSLAWLMGELHRRKGVPLRRVMLEFTDGFIEHKDSDQGSNIGKSDVGYMLDWGKLL